MKRGVAIHRRNQANRIWELLLSRGGKWIPARELSEISLQYRRTINSLRGRGVLIENKIVIEGGVQHSFYRLKPTPRLIGRHASAGEQLSLFSSSELERIAQGWTDPEEQTR